MPQHDTRVTPTLIGQQQRYRPSCSCGWVGRVERIDNAHSAADLHALYGDDPYPRDPTAASEAQHGGVG